MMLHAALATISAFVHGILGTRRACGRIAAFALLAAIFATPAPAVPRPEVRTLDNGLRVAVFRDPRLPLVQVQLTAPAGSAAEVRGQAGAARLSAEMLRRGTTSRLAAAYAADIDRLGGSVSSTSGRDFATLTGVFLAADFAAGMELLADAALRPAFTDSMLQRQRLAQMRSIGQQMLNPAQAADDLAWARLWDGTPYARPVLGRFEGLRVLTTEAVREFHGSHWSPDRSVLAIAGDVDPEAAFQVAREWFGGWTRRPAPVAAAVSAPPGARVVILDRPELETVELRLAMRGPRRGDDDEPAMALAARIAGDGPGAWLKSGAGLRQSRAGQLALREGGLFWLAGSAALDSATVAARTLRTTLERLAHAPPPESEWLPARQALAGTLPLSLETLGSVLNQWSGSALYGLPQDDVRAFLRRVDATDGERLAAALTRWCDVDRAVLVAVGRATSLSTSLAEFGPVEVVAVSQLAGRAEDEMKPLPEFTVAQQKSGRDLVRRMLVAHGGVAKLRSMKDSAIKADVVIYLDGREAQGTLEQVRREPYHMMYVTSFSGFTTRQVLTGSSGWIADTQGRLEAQELDSASVAGLRGGFEADVPHLLLAAFDPATRVGETGRQRIAGREVIGVELRPVRGPRSILHVDASTFRLVAVDQSEGAAAGFPARRVYGDLRSVKGLWLPFSEERLLNGNRVMSVVMTRFDWNAGVEDAIFQKPDRPLPPPSR